MSDYEFADILALANALPGPSATKLAGYISYQQGRTEMFASVVPSLAAMIALLQLVYTFKDSPKVKQMTNYIRPAVACCPQ
jgi:chromate transporter